MSARWWTADADPPDADALPWHDAGHVCRCGAGWDHPCECPRRCDWCGAWDHDAHDFADGSRVCDHCAQNAPACDVCGEAGVRTECETCRWCVEVAEEVAP